MPIPQKVKDYLNKNKIKYEEILHKTVYTAFDLAQTLRKDLKEIAKHLLIQADKAYIIVIVPASTKVDLKKLKKALKVKKISLPSEQIMTKVFKVKPGLMTPFGRLHKIQTWVDKSLLKVQSAIFSVGSFTDSVRMKVKDFIKLEEAKLGNFSQKGGYKLQVKVVPKKKSGRKK